MRRMLARMLVRENAGVAGYSEAFMYGQSSKQASIRSSYLITDVLGELQMKKPLLLISYAILLEFRRS
jgi:hypothetical protein